MFEPPLHGTIGCSSVSTARYRMWIQKLLALDARKIDPRPPRCWSRKGFTFSFIDLTDPTRIYAATSFRHRIFLTSE